MKICCSQEHYDKVVQYAKSINDKTPKTVLNVSNNGKRTRAAHAKSNSITTMRRIRSDSANVIRTGIQALSEDCCIMEIRTNPLPSSWNVSTDGAYIPTYIRQSVLGSLMQYGVPFFYAGDMMTASSFLAAKIAVCRATPARRPCRAGCLEKIILASLRYFFPPSLAGMRANRQQGQQEIRMPVPYRQTMYNNKNQKS